MKSQADTSISLDFLGTNQQQFGKDIIKCTGGNQAFQYCFNQNCIHKQIFLCGIRKCKCREQHGFCPKADLDVTIEHINLKITDTTLIKKNIEQSFDIIIDQISEIRDKILIQIDKQMRLNLLHDIEKQFLQIVNSHQDQNFTSKQSAKLWKIISKNYKGKYDTAEEIKLQLKKYENNILQTVKSIQFNLQKIIQKQQLIELNTLQIVSNQNLNEVFKSKSSILTEDQFINKLQSFFIKKPTNAQLLFKASDYEFNLKTYYEICGTSTQTMIICKTNKDKIIGGYSPLSFYPASNKIQYIEDDSVQSMLFSISQNDKFQLKDKTKAIRHMPDKSHVRIGNAEFDICDKADTVQQCYTYLTNQFYGNAKYKNDKQSYNKLNGNDSFKFCVKEWEVWKIQFSNKIQQN